jgi:hypothetical protein
MVGTLPPLFDQTDFTLGITSGKVNAIPDIHF